MSVRFYHKGKGNHAIRQNLNRRQKKRIWVVEYSETVKQRQEQDDRTEFSNEQ